MAKLAVPDACKIVAFSSIALPLQHGWTIKGATATDRYAIGPPTKNGC
jgi:hypothetical protein